MPRLELDQNIDVAFRAEIVAKDRAEEGELPDVVVGDEGTQSSCQIRNAPDDDMLEMAWIVDARALGTGACSRCVWQIQQLYCVPSFPRMPAE
jgi:hypothetical protein